MPLKDVKASPEQIAQLETLKQKRRREAAAEALYEQERMTEERILTMQDGTKWTYVVFDDDYVRIIGCDTASTVLDIPESIEQKPVRELGMDSCSALETVTEIVCPSSIAAIGRCAFRFDSALRRIVLPRNLEAFDVTWVRGCDALEDLVLPGLCHRIDSSLFDLPALRFLTLGSGAREVIPGAFTKSRLARISVDPENPYLATDGFALASADGDRLVALAVPVESYRIPDGCRVIGKKAFSGRKELGELTLPDSLEAIEPYALSRTGLVEFVAPPSLKHIGERAFYRSQQLRDIYLDEGLLSIDDYAFAGTALTRLRVPASIETLGVSVVDDGVMQFGDEEAGFSIAPGAKVLSIDGLGGLYRNTPNGKHLVRMLDRGIGSYAVQEGTRVIDDYAFTRHKRIRSVALPEGLEIIAEAAFRDCRELADVRFPESLRVIGNEAFLDTSLASVYLPAGFEKLGSMALITHGAHHKDAAPSLRNVEVAQGNEHFYVIHGMLCERMQDGSVQVVLFSDVDDHVIIPEEVTRIGEYAFSGARNLRELHISNRIKRIGTRGLDISSTPELLHIDLAEPVEGHTSFDLRFPDSRHSKQGIFLAFSTSSWVDLEKILNCYDVSIINMHEYDQKRSDDIDVYAQASRMLERLLDPVFMTKVNRSLYDTIINDDLDEICIAVARNDDRNAIDALVELGYLNGDNLMHIIDVVGNLQDAAMTGYLLELKRRLFKRSTIDFDL